MKTEMLPKQKCYQNWNVTKYSNVLKIKIKIQEIGTDHLGLVSSLIVNLKTQLYIWASTSGVLLTLLYKKSSFEKLQHDKFAVDANVTVAQTQTSF